MPQPRPLRPNDPREIGGFVLLARLGEGGQGTVYLGRSAAGEQVAVKVLRAELEEGSAARRYLERELAAVRRVAPFCTARVLAAETDGEQPYVVSEYIDGPSLQRLVGESGPLRGDELLRLAIGTATALAAIHQAGVVHRDLKPANVLLGPDGPRVIDFGIARPLDATSATMSAAVGTPAYMAPEQLAGGAAGPALDMFAWGCTMAYAANGSPPFGHDSIPAVMNRIAHGSPSLGALDGPLRDLVAACLNKDPAQRPTALQALTALLGGGEHRDPLAEGTSAAADLTPAAIPPPGPPPVASPVAPPGPLPGPPPFVPPPPPRSPGRQGPLIAAAAVAVAVALLGGTAVAIALSQDGPDRTTPGGPGAVQATDGPLSAEQGGGSPAAAGTCRYRPNNGGATKDVGTPPSRPSATGPVQATLTTNRGTITLELDGAKAPCTVNSMIYLAGRGFYDDTRCHRLTTVASLKVLQCGDPTGTGTGGPAYQFDNENTANARYTRGTVAMANAGPGTNGSQFFILYGDAAGLPSDYTVFGRVTSGLDILDDVARAGADDSNGSGDGSPKKPVTIERFHTALG